MTENLDSSVDGSNEPPVSHEATETESKFSLTRITKNKRALGVIGGVAVIAIAGTTIFALNYKSEPGKTDTLDKAFTATIQESNFPDCAPLEKYVTSAFDFTGLKSYTVLALQLTDSSDAEGFMNSNPIATPLPSSATFEDGIEQLTDPSLLAMVAKQYPNFKAEAAQQASWSKDWTTAALDHCGLVDVEYQNSKTLSNASDAFAKVSAFASQQKAQGADVKQAFPGYPLVVSMGSINPKVAVWIQRESTATQLVALAPGVYTPYNPNIPNLSKYYDAWIPTYGDCGMIHQYFKSLSFACGPGILAGSEEP